ncbi:MAG: hypothetical protein J5858_01510 [Lentisphaeria bacterium]|nr:hypothetical protein [Lentisphaeria bacterium]
MKSKKKPAKKGRKNGAKETFYQDDKIPRNQTDSGINFFEGEKLRVGD